MARKPIQFNWRRHWRKKVEPHLGHPLVQGALSLGMGLLDPAWEVGDPPTPSGASSPARGS
jgi:hypothetical protein